MSGSAHSIKFYTLSLSASTALSTLSVWGGGTLTSNQPMDLCCGACGGFAAAPQLTTVGVTSYPNTYPGNQFSRSERCFPDGACGSV